MKLGVRVNATLYLHVLTYDMELSDTLNNKEKLLLSAVQLMSEWTTKVYQLKK
ncbi:hypothetical protein Back11_43770 [Paenibacillus baekrokdamisoli]|uniref:Uncharacterized protein n=1 Tax=Paenibacillus baekrokdamisoli TaxID=1712516 RepID=A0A3G9IXH5_9BACL|nr:hypothetical protein Back11_43770 [Paenibacillus baekrokdamisoli]